MKRQNLKKQLDGKWVVLLIVFVVIGCSSASQTWLEGKPRHHVKDGFRNHPEIPEVPPTKPFFYLRRFYTSFILPDVPSDHVISENLAIAQFNELQEKDSITWLGQSTFLIRLDGLTILTDPYLTTYASSVWGLGPKRFAPPGISLENLPPIEVIVLSHNHLDHLDSETVASIKNKDRIQVYVPLGLKSFFTKRGYQHVDELDWYDQKRKDSLTFTSLPTVHHSGRSLGDKNKTLWCSWNISSVSQKIYFVGDSGYSPTIFKEIGEKMGPVDLALLTIGAYDTRQGDPMTHLYPEAAVKVGLDLNAETIVGMHWGTIQLSDEPPFEPPVRFKAAADKAGYSEDNTWIFKIGETRALPERDILGIAANQ
ncbi:MBL fold metallo-hydrolase [bacterium]|nr:MBL fold metallo-hydrolase [bacterium]